MDDLPLENLRQKIAFIDQNATGRTGASVQKVWDNARIILVPVKTPFFVVRKLLLRVGLFPCLAPARTRDLVLITEIAEFHYIIDPHPAIAIVVVVRLPERAEGVRAD